MNQIKFRVDANSEIGLGHLMRCLSLATELSRRGMSCGFFTKTSDESAHQMIASKGFAHVRLPANLSFADEAGAIAAQAGECSAPDFLVADLTHPQALAMPESEIKAWSKGLGRESLSLVLIDGHGEQILFKKIAVPAALWITPYAGSTPQTLPAGAKHLAGLDYFIFSPEFSALIPKEPRMIRKKAQRLLITFGGSDPTRITPKVMRSLSLLPHALEVSVVIGPCFKDELSHEIESLAKTLPNHHWNLIRAPKSMGQLMLDCDAAISSTGLTKYELAALGTPSLLLSIDRVHAQLNRSYAETGVAETLGEASLIPEEEICSALDRLLSDESKRAQMSRDSQNLLDGQGSARIADEISLLARASR